jgi:hypothetical protein
MAGWRQRRQRKHCWARRADRGGVELEAVCRACWRILAAAMQLLCGN